MRVDADDEDGYSTHDRPWRRLLFQPNGKLSVYGVVCVSRTSTHSTREEVANGSHKITIDYSAEVTHVVALTVTHELDHELDHVNHLERDRLPNGHQPYGHWSARVCFVPTAFSSSAISE